MPRKQIRRKIHNNNNAGEEDIDAPKRKRERIAFKLPLTKRLSVEGQVLVCGTGEMGQLGLGDDASKLERKRPAPLESISNAVDICAGGMHSLVLTADGRVYSFGCNDEGALGRDTSEEGSEFEPYEVELPGKAVKLSAGDSHTACLLEDGRVLAWGSFRDSHGNMGLTLEGNKRLPVEVLPGTICADIASGADHLVLLTCEGKVYTVGCAEQGQLGRVSMRSASGEGRRGKTDLLRPGQVIIKRGGPIQAIWATNYCTFLQEAHTDTIWAFGLNNYKQLGYAKNDSVIVSPVSINFSNVYQIAGGQHHTIFVNENGECYVIGRRDYGRLGLGKVAADVEETKPIKSLSTKNIVMISCGESQSFALTHDGKLYSWGMGSSYQLGTGSDEDVLEPVLIVSKHTQDKRVIRVSTGGQHNMLLVENDTQPKAETKQEKQTLTKKAAAVAAAKEREAKKIAATDEQEVQKPAAETNTNSNGDSVADDAGQRKEPVKRARKKN